MSASLQELLCQRGVLLFLIGLLIGVAIPAFKSPRIALAAHVSALNMGITLMAVGLLGSHLALSDGVASVIAHTLWLGFFVLTAGLTLAAAFSTGRTLPLAGGGVAAARWQELSAALPILAGSTASLGAFAALLWHWSWR